MSDRETERRKRLSEALRENLKRRKSQSRGRSDQRTSEPDVAAPEPTPDDDVTDERM